MSSQEGFLSETLCDRQGCSGAHGRVNSSSDLDALVDAISYKAGYGRLGCLSGPSWSHRLSKVAAGVRVLVRVGSVGITSAGL
ncbi:hypothetical protein V8C44DRAFT_344646 [Trichoderma aethiopicum]